MEEDSYEIADLIPRHAVKRPDAIALIEGPHRFSYAELDRRMDRIAAALQRDALGRGATIGIAALSSIEYMTTFLGAVRIGVAVAPLPTSASPDALARMIADSGAALLFVDDAGREALGGRTSAARVIGFGDECDAWIGASPARPVPVVVGADDPFNLIYSSGTTGVPKGIVQSHAMRSAYIERTADRGFETAITLIATPLYSNTTLVSLLPTLGWGGTAILMPKFEARAYLELAQQHHATHTMLVPIQYQRLMDVPDFDTFDLSAFRLKTSTSAPFSASLKADIVARWPGGLVEFYGMTEGGASTGLDATARPDKLHTVGQPLPDHHIRLIGEDGREVANGDVGEVVGRSPTMMTGYHGLAAATEDAEWHDADGVRYIRHGDLARIDDEGFVILIGRKKDLIISGGFNLYPSDLEAVLSLHPAVAECAVIGVPSDRWGETPFGFYVPRAGEHADATAIMAWTNERLGRTQRLSGLQPIDALPRSAIGKVLKRELADRLTELAD